MELQQAIRRAWETFLETGREPTGVSEILAASWARSHTLGVGVSRSEAPLAGEPEVFRRRSSLTDLLGAARPALQRSRTLLADASSMMVLTDASGLIVEATGDERVLDGGRRNHLEVGGHWDESAIGTNAIGTALAEGRPLQIHGAEHFCEDVQRWTCAATPVRHPLDGELLGIVDISGPAASFNPQSLALAIALGQEIEATLGRTARAEHELLLQYFACKRASWLSEETLLVDRRGVVVHATERARSRLGVATPEALARDIKEVIDRAGRDAWEENCRRRFPNASMHVVRHEGAEIGSIIVLHRARARATTAAPRSTDTEASITFDDILGDSAAIHQARDQARKLAASALPILIEGETGVGKELFARAIKYACTAAEGPFVPVNCGGIARDLIASELFGYVRGAFTGADEHGSVGKIEKADGGLLCLDEIGEMPIDLQSYLLRVLEDGIVYRIGSHQPRKVAFRVVSMTNRDLLAEADAGRFRRDLYYRLSAAYLRIPPLRERQDDALLLAERFAQAAARRLDRATPRFSPGVLAALGSYHWPGNVRELRNVVETMVALAATDTLTEQDLPRQINGASVSVSDAATSPAYSSSPRHPANPGDLKTAQRSAILGQVEACGGNLTRAAERLGMARSTLYLRLAEYGYRRASA
jgi:transcriptional regulator of acetoin/glycerol metabolism